MPHIQQLSPHVADLIAAGEVVERPASVVKELIENAIDAGASAVVVELQNGGMSLIRVTDNGCGIAPGELPTAFLRHATSKLRQPEDLAAIGTLGFRGEALAAISAVSRLDVFTRQKGAQLGASLHLEGGVPGPVEEAGCPEGTTFAVRELFYNTPARLKFMKTDSAEASAAAGVIAQIALSHPEVSIRYLRDGKEELHTPGDGKLLSAIYAARGRDFALRLTEVEGGGEGVSVRGFVTEPLAGRGNRAMQTFFCCGRMIKSALLTAALEEAYANRQMKGKYPGCVLHIDLPLHMVDVNVHPAKTVVKFVNERALFSAVHHTVKDALDAAANPSLFPSASQTVSQPAPAKPVTAVQQPRSDFYQTMDAKSFREKAAASQKKPAASVMPLTPELGSRVFFHDSGRPQRPPRQMPEVPSAPAYTVRTFTPPPPPATEAKAAGVAAEPVKHTVKHSVEPAAPAQVPEQTAFAAKPTPWRFAGEVLHTYIIAEDGDNVWLIDKHAAHERINFDRMKANAEPIMRQQLLAPLAVDLPQEQYAVLLENLPLLEEFGFEAEDFGTGCLMVRGIPSDLDTGLVRETLEELSEKLLTSGGADPAAARDVMLHTMACKASIKGGWTSDPSELKVLIEKVQSGEVQYCPHGRPVKIRLTKYEIEKMFKRA
ncbi:MAG: DNA mismatch repair endonuclease MutL [Oscillibacter sp.]|nr:DNA mismatch repair endonuclease MutL [Oscillibacter sp.]